MSKANTDTWSSVKCQICQDAGVVHPIIDGKVDYSQTVPCTCQTEQIKVHNRQALLQYCELPPMCNDMTFKSFKAYTELGLAYGLALDIAKKPGALTWLIIMGDNDVGKTHLAVAICRAWIMAGIASKYAFVPILLDELREGFRRPEGDDYSARFRRLCTVPLLLLDDLGAESSTAWVQEKLEALVDYRYMNKLSLIVTTNKGIEELPPRLGSRLARHPNAILVNINSVDYTTRRTKGKYAKQV